MHRRERGWRGGPWESPTSMGVASNCSAGEAQEQVSSRIPGTSSDENEYQEFVKGRGAFRESHADRFGKSGSKGDPNDVYDSTRWETLSRDGSSKGTRLPHGGV